MKTADALLRRARQWNEDALTQIYDTFAPVIYRYVYRHVGHQNTAEEITAETFHRFLVALKQGGGPTEHLSAWLYRVAHNLIVDFYRRQPAQEPESLDGVEETLAESDRGVVHVEQQMQVERARAALRQLTPLQQQVITLRYLEELSNAEIARVVERTEGAVKALQHRALDSLRRILEEGNET
ncbi:MAG TPA: sigma-70 family RNA polymerase sigma factor [Anaerolineae bacterium]|nr:sigma-70 family RNA polymerase sigma factor [Anaerolineae bacterium]HQK13865.1 sigma-70 family RNA polymerase sigma factor [Anaerolineae bacterium]